MCNVCVNVPEMLLQDVAYMLLCVQIACNFQAKLKSPSVTVQTANSPVISSMRSRRNADKPRVDGFKQDVDSSWKVVFVNKDGRRVAAQ